MSQLVLNYMLNMVESQPDFEIPHQKPRSATAFVHVVNMNATTVTRSSFSGLNAEPIVSFVNEALRRSSSFQYDTKDSKPQTSFIEEISDDSDVRIGGESTHVERDANPASIPNPDELGDLEESAFQSDHAFTYGDEYAAHADLSANHLEPDTLFGFENASGETLDYEREADAMAAPHSQPENAHVEDQRYSTPPGYNTTQDDIVEL
jgi:hypothetical protein